MKRLAVITILSLLCACNDEPRTDATIRIRLDTDSLDVGCASSLCSDYSMSCGGVVSLRVTNPKTGEVLLRDKVEPIALCLRAPPGAELCAVRDLDMQLFGIPAQNVRIEVAIYNPDQLQDGANRCPSPKGFELFDAFGRPNRDYDSALAFAGAAYIQAGQSEVVDVPLFCPRPDKLSEDSCTANQPANVRAVVIDMTNMQTIRKEQALNVSVDVGEAHREIDNTGATTYVLDSNDTTGLLLNSDDPVAVYENQVSPRLGSIVCTTTFDGQPQATIAARCQEAPNLAATLDLQAVLVRKTIVDAALLALGETSFPDAGIIIGRAVNENLSPTAGVTITPSAGGTVLYLDDDLQLSNLSSTSNSAYFVATDVPFASVWAASHPDGRRQSGSPRGGLIRGKVSAVIIRLTGDVIGD